MFFVFYLFFHSLEEASSVFGDFFINFIVYPYTKTALVLSRDSPYSNRHDKKISALELQSAI